jgi:hypothetical protein
MSVSYCASCGATIHVGDFPFCPHGPAHFAAIGDELTGGFLQENFGDKPEYFDSKRAMAKRADELNLRQVSEGDKKRGHYGVTAKTLADAAALLSRAGQRGSKAVCETATFTTGVWRES